MEDESAGGIRWTLILLIVGVLIVVYLGSTISKNSVQNTMIRAKTIVVSSKKKERAV